MRVDADELLQRVRNPEDGFLERKPDGTSSTDLKRTIVAFANSVPEGSLAVLYIGVTDNGKITGVKEPDKLQKTIGRIAEEDCYPPIRHQCKVLRIDEKDVLAVIIPASGDRPHFAGPAFVRIGSQSVRASEELYDELIASRNTATGAILRHKGELITYRCIDTDQWGRERTRYTNDCRVENCDAHVVDLYDVGSGRHFSMSLNKIRLNKDQTKQRFMLDGLGDP